MDKVLSFFSQNYISIIILLTLLFFMQYKSKIGEKNVSAIRYGGIVVLILTLTAFLDVKVEWGVLGEAGRIIRLLLASMNYLLRSLAAIFLILQIWRRKEHYKFIFIPFIIQAVLLLVNIFWRYAFDYRLEDNVLHFARSPYGFIILAIPFLYTALVFVLTVVSNRERERSEAFLLFWIATTTAIAAIMEVVYVATDILTPTMAFAFAQFYLFLQISSSRRDALTGLLNRHSFYEDIEKRDRHITAVISFDMNDLKAINDTKGHAAGDIAIEEIAKTIFKEKSYGSRAYRMGGDEFTILVFDTKENSVTSMIERMREGFQNKGYSCAIGYCVREGEQPVQDLLTIADKKMYECKKEMKSTLVR